MTKTKEKLSTKEKSLIKAGNLKKVGVQTIPQWVKDAWSEILSEMTIRSIKKCCISNAMDSSEDHFVYDEDNIIDCASDAETDDIHPDVQMTANKFEELFGNSDSQFEGFE